MTKQDRVLISKHINSLLTYRTMTAARLADAVFDRERYDRAHEWELEAAEALKALGIKLAGYSA